MTEHRYTGEDGIGTYVQNVRGQFEKIEQLEPDKVKELYFYLESIDAACGRKLRQLMKIMAAADYEWGSGEQPLKEITVKVSPTIEDIFRLAKELGWRKEISRKTGIAKHKVLPPEEIQKILFGK